MRKKLTIFLISGTLALLAIFVLVAFARSLIQDSIDITADDLYSKLAQQDQAAERFNTPDPYVTAARQPPALATDPSKGASAAALTIVEYGDFECPFCADLAPLLDRLIREREVRVIWKDLPNPGHLQARSAANAARCAQAQDKFWAYHDILFLNQDQLSQELYFQAAELTGLELTGFTACLANFDYDDLVMEGLAEAGLYAVDATPYLFIGAQRVDQLVNYDELLRLVDQQLSN